MAVPAAVKALRVVGGAVALLLVVASGASIVGGFFERIEVVSTPLPEGRTAVVVDLDLGSVTVSQVPIGEPGRVTRTAHWVTRPPRSSIVSSGSSTTVHGQCPGGQALVNRCRVDVDIELPSGAAARVSTGTGDVWLTALSGEVDVATGTGDVTGRGLMSSWVTGRSDTGDVALGFAMPPTRVDVRVSTGDIALTLPTAPSGEGYRFTAEAPVGDATVTVPADPAGTRTITAVTGVGDVTIRGGP